MTCYVERRGVFVRCELRDCGPGDGWELVIADHQHEDGSGMLDLHHHLADEGEAMSLPSESWNRRRPVA